MAQKANLEQIRHQNRRIILRSLRLDSSVARVDLGQRTKLSPATVTSITSDLIGEGLIREILFSNLDKTGSRGRPKVLLTLNEDAAYILGVKISANRLEMLLTDYKGNKLDMKSSYIPTASSTKIQFIDDLIRLLDGFYRSNNVPQEQLAEIGISAQGVVNSKLGEISWSPAFSERNINLKNPLEKAFGVKCTISNDTNMIAQALHWKKPNYYGGTFAVLFIESGVGGGFFVNDQLYTGVGGAAAEIGHVNHIVNGNLCRCGKRGCLEAYLSDYAILRSADNLPGDFDPSNIAVSREKILDVAEKANSGNEFALRAFNEAGRALGFGIARLIATLDIGLVVITGAGSLEFPLMEASMNEALGEALVKDLRNEVEIKVLPWQEDIVLTGIIASALHRLDSDVFASSKRQENPLQV